MLKYSSLTGCKVWVMPLVSVCIYSYNVVLFKFGSCPMENIHWTDKIYIFCIWKINLISRFQNLGTSLAYIFYIELWFRILSNLTILFLQAVNFGNTSSARNITYHAKLMRDVYCHHWSNIVNNHLKLRYYKCEIYGIIIDTNCIKTSMGLNNYRASQTSILALIYTNTHIN